MLTRSAVNTTDRSAARPIGDAVLVALALALGPGCALSHLAEPPAHDGAPDAGVAPLAPVDAAVALDGGAVHDGGTEEPPDAPPLVCPTEPLAPGKATVLWVLDASRAWSEAPDAHASVRAAIVGVAGAWRTADHALSIFPGETSSCDPDDHVALEAEWGDPLAPALDEVMLAGAGEVGPALAGALIAASARVARVPERATSSILVTHASPRPGDVVCDEASRDRVAEAAAGASDAGVRLYVIAISEHGEADGAWYDELRELSERTGGGAIVSTVLGAADALGTLRTRLESCTAHVASERVPTRVEVRFDSGPRLALERVESPSTCHDGGYLIDDRGESAVVTLCPAACDIALELGEVHGAPRMVDAARCGAE